MSTDTNALRELADSLDSCSWCHPLCSAAMCRSAANDLDEARRLIQSVLKTGMATSDWIAAARKLMEV